MNRHIDDIIDLCDASLLAAAHDRLKRSLENAVQMATDLGRQPVGGVTPRVRDLLAELDVAKHAADAIRQADA